MLNRIFVFFGLLECSVFFITCFLVLSQEANGGGDSSEVQTTGELDELLYSDPRYQEESLGRKNCSFHNDFYHATIGISTCSQVNHLAYICNVSLLKQIKLFVIRTYESATVSLDIPCFMCVSTGVATPGKLNLLHVLEESKDSALDFDGTVKEQLALVKSVVETVNRFREKYDVVENSECSICMETGSIFKKITKKDSRCAKSFCKSCLHQYIKISLNDLSKYTVSGIPCPGCNDILPDIVIEFLVSIDAIRVLNKNIMKIAAHANKNIFICLNPLCQGAYSKEDMCREAFICPQCEKDQCVKCDVLPFHAGLSCEAYQLSLTTEGAEEFYKKLRERESNNYKDCPVCQTTIYKLFGCNDMQCTVCKTHFCWMCMTVIQDRTHFEGSQRCDLWAREDNSPFTRRCPSIDQSKGACIRCQSQEAFKLDCGHFFCNACWQEEQSSMPGTSSAQHDTRYCMQCLNEGRRSVAQHKEEATVPSVLAALSRCQYCEEERSIITKSWACGHHCCYECVTIMRTQNVSPVCGVCRKLSLPARRAGRKGDKKGPAGNQKSSLTGKQCISCMSFISDDLDLCDRCISIFYQ